MSAKVPINDNFLIENNLIKCLGTPQFLQAILGAARVRIKNNVITSISPWPIVFSFVFIVLATYSCYVFQEFFFTAYFHEDLLLYLSCCIGNGMVLISYIITICLNRFSKRDTNVKIYSMLQKVDRTLGSDKTTYYTDFQYRWNVFIIFLIIVGFFNGYAANAYVLLEKPIYSMFFAFGLLSMFMDNVLGFAMMYFLFVRLKIFNKIIKKLIEQYKGNVEKKPKEKTLRKFLIALMIPRVEALDCPREKWLEFLQDVLKCYKIVVDLFSFSVFNLSLTVLIWTFTVIAAIVVGFRSGLYPLAATVTVGLWAGFYYVQLTASAIINNWFIQEIKKTKLLCIRLISYDYDGPYQKTASEIINLIHYDTPVFDVYGIFVLDKQLPLEIIGVVATNVLVLIQFII